MNFLQIIVWINLLSDLLLVCFAVVLISLPLVPSASLFLLEMVGDPLTVGIMEEIRTEIRRQEQEEEAAANSSKEEEEEEEAETVKERDKEERGYEL